MAFRDRRIGSRRAGRVSVLALAASLTVAACGGQTTPAGPSSGVAPTKVSVQASYLLNVEYYGFIYPAHTGGYKSAGLDVQVTPGGQGINAVQEVVSGTADIGVATAQVIIDAASRGAPVVVLAAEYGISPLALTCRADSGVKKLSDIKGKRIGVKQISEPVFGTLLRKNNLTPRDVQTFPIGRTDVSTIIAGKVDCMITTLATNEPLTMQRRGVAPVVFTLADHGMPSQGNVYFTSATAWETKRPFLLKWLDVTKNTWGAFLKDPAAAATWLVNSNITPGLDLGQQIAQAKAQVRYILPPGTPTSRLLALNPAIWRQTAADQHASGAAANLVNIEKLLAPPSTLSTSGG